MSARGSHVIIDKFLEGESHKLTIRLVRPALRLMGSSSVDYSICVVAKYCIRRLVAPAAAAGNIVSLSYGLRVW